VPPRAGQDLALPLVHETGGLRLVVIPAGQMQHAVNDEKVELESHRDADPLRLATGGVGADDDLAEEAGGSGCLEIEGEHVGGRAPAEITCVQAANLAITHHAHVELTVRPPQRAKGGLGGATHAEERDVDPALEIADHDGHQLPGEGNPSSPPWGERVG